MKASYSLALISSSLFFIAAGFAVAADYKVVPVANGGTVSGRVSLNAAPPPPAVQKVDEDAAVCGAADRPSEELLVGANRGVQNVVLSIETVGAGKDWDLPATFVYDQKKCTFVPRMIMIKPEMEGVVLNSDSVGHNFHTISQGVYNINKKIQPDTKLVVAKGQIRRSGMIRAKCDIHSWMGGWWVVADTPYTVISDKDGNFSITQVPPGTYTLKIWHEKLGESKQNVVVKAGETAKVDVVLKL
jgi:carboxypeptidase family protein